MTTSIDDDTWIALIAGARRLGPLDEPARLCAERMIDLSIRGLPSMVRKEAGQVYYTVRGPELPPKPEGRSLRYAAILSLGLRWLPPGLQREILLGQDLASFVGDLQVQAEKADNLGSAALVAWAACDLRLPNAERSVARTLTLLAGDADPKTVEMSWVVSALASAHDQPGAEVEARKSAARLSAACHPASGLFPMVLSGRAGGVRRHVGCFADQVYPIQALSRFHRAFGDEAALSMADRCAQRICDLQGDHGQWWWHYDVRSGEVVEGYPVYSVHQDAMGPMALLDLEDAGGRAHVDALERSLAWMDLAPEIGGSLADDSVPVIWRKVCRNDPKKIVRGIRALSTRIHPSLRIEALDSVFPPTGIDHESRPYHLGWVLLAWLGRL